MNRRHLLAGLCSLLSLGPVLLNATPEEPKIKGIKFLGPQGDIRILKADKPKPKSELISYIRRAKSLGYDDYELIY